MSYIVDTPVRSVIYNRSLFNVMPSVDTSSDEKTSSSISEDDSSSQRVQEPQKGS